MTDAPTKDLTDSEKLNLILAELTDLKAWRAEVDAALEDRTKETRPKLDLIIKELSDMREDITDIRDRQARLERKFDVLLDDSMELRSHPLFKPIPPGRGD